MPLISETTQWKSLEEHVNVINKTHLKTLLQDKDRNAILTAEHDGIILDYSRQRVLPETMVRFYSYFEFFLKSI